MMGIKERVFKTHPDLTLDKLLPEKHFYRQLEHVLELSFVRDLVRDFYPPYGRPSIDPVVFFKLQLIMLFEDIRSERQLMDQLQVNLAFRWYIGYDLDETVPDHSSLTRIRERFGLSVFRHFFEQVLQLCFDAGLVWGKELFFDGTQVQANAAKDSYVPNFEYELRNHLNILFPNEAPTALQRPPLDLMENWVETYKQEQPLNQRNAYVTKSAQNTSLTDPDASFLRSQAHLGYHTHYVVDGGKQRIILAALVTPADVTDNQPMLDLLRWLRFRWRLQPRQAVGDSKYGTTDNIVALFQEAVLPLVARTDYATRNQFYGPEAFRYDAAQDLYYCPQGQVLKKQGQHKDTRTYVYYAKAKVCRDCPVRLACTNSKRGRSLHRSFFQTELDRAAELRETELYKKAMRKRQVWVEPMFAEGKQWHRLRRFRLRRLWRVNIEALLIASVQNLKRLMKPQYTRGYPLTPAPSAVLALSQHPI